VNITRFLEAMTGSKREAGDPIYLFGYNGTSGAVNFTDTEYEKTVIIEKKRGRKGKNQPKAQIVRPLAEFLNSGKSISTGKCLNAEGNFVIYKASTSAGSSGGPLFDKHGKLIGISFGNFGDIESKEEIPDNPGKLECFDISVPSEEINQASRNYNLGTAIQHSGLLRYLGRSPEVPLLNDFGFTFLDRI